MTPRKRQDDRRASDVIFCLRIILFIWLIVRAILRAWAAIRSARETFPATYTGSDGEWQDLDTALARPAAPGELHISRNIDLEGQYNIPVADRHWAVQAPGHNIDADNATHHAHEADLELLLALGEVVGLPRQIERDEENMDGRPSASLVGDLAAGGPHHLPRVIPAHEIDAIDAPDSEASSSGFTAQGSAVDLPLQIETDEANRVRRPAQVRALDVVHGVDDERLQVPVSGVGLPGMGAMDLGVSAGGSTMSSGPLQPSMLETDTVDAARDAEAEGAGSLAFGSTVGLRQRSERDDAHTDGQHLVVSSVAPSLVDNGAAGVPQHLPTTLPSPEIVEVDASVPELGAIEALVHDIDAVDAHVLEMDAIDAPASEIVGVDTAAPEISAVDAPVLEIGAIEALTPGMDALDASMLEMDASDAPGHEIVSVDASVPELDATEALVHEIDAVDALVLELRAPASEIVAVNAPGPEITTVDALVLELRAIDAPVSVIVAVNAPGPEITTVDAPVPEMDAVDAPMPEIVAVGAARVHEIVAGDAPASGTNAIDPLDLPQQIARDEAHRVRRLAEAPVMDVAEDEAGKASVKLLGEGTSDGAAQALIATPSLVVAAGGLESNLEERMPSHHNGNFAEIQVDEVNSQDDVEI